MTHTLLKAAAIATAFAAPAMAMKPGLYGQLHGELSFAEDEALDINGVNQGDVKYDVEYAIGLSLGYRPDSQGFLGSTRYEIETMYREADFDEFTNTTIAPGGFGGSIESYTLMGNVYYDYYNSSNWTPYVGLGLGVAQQNFDSVTINTDDDDTVLAYQAMLGVAHAIDPYDNVDVGFGYRYFGTDEINVTSSTGNNVSIDYGSHNFEAFIRIGF